MTNGLLLTTDEDGREISVDDYIAILTQSDDVEGLRSNALALLSTLCQRCADYDELSAGYASLVAWARSAALHLDEADLPPAARTKKITITDASGDLIRVATIGPA